MEAHDGKMRLTDVADTQQLLPLVQLIPSPKVEPYKMWLENSAFEAMPDALETALRTH